METEFKTLVYMNDFVDANSLEKGIYTSKKPAIYDKEETIETIIERINDINKLGINLLFQIGIYTI